MKASFKKNSSNNNQRSKYDGYQLRWQQLQQGWMWLMCLDVDRLNRRLFFFVQIVSFKVQSTPTALFSSLNSSFPSYIAINIVSWTCYLGVFSRLRDSSGYKLKSSCIGWDPIISAGIPCKQQVKVFGCRQQISAHLKKTPKQRVNCTSVSWLWCFKATAAGNQGVGVVLACMSEVGPPWTENPACSYAP